MALLVKRLSASATIPKRGSELAAGFDLYSTEGCVILPGKRAVLPTGVAIMLPKGTYGRIAPRSGLAVKHGINVGAGVVDRDYTGELKVVLFSHAYVVKPGYRIAQLIIEKCEYPPIVEVDSLDETQRGDDGFGSTGVETIVEPEPAPANQPIAECSESELEDEPEPMESEPEHSYIPETQPPNRPAYMGFHNTIEEPDMAEAPEPDSEPEPEPYY